MKKIEKVKNWVPPAVVRRVAAHGAGTAKIANTAPTKIANTAPTKSTSYA